MLAPEWTVARLDGGERRAAAGEGWMETLETPG
jgi:hypothetical protein